ncbi:MAG: DUF4249 domain-containing protein [Bacteroidota bacterium]|nr:DUF4249 domain-containing protein [Bacteroidota bacterium]
MKQYILACCLICAGCETVVEVEVPQYDSKLVVTSHFSPDSIWSVSLHRSLTIGVRQNPSALYVEGATVTILNDDGIAESLVYQGSGLYGSVIGTQPIAGVRYRLHVESGDEPQLTAASTAPLPPLITYSSIETVAENVPSGLTPHNIYRLSITFTDVPTEENYYRIGVYHYQRNHGFIESTPDSVYKLIHVYAPALGWYCGFSEAIGGPAGNLTAADICDSFVVTDRLFDGEEYHWGANVDLENYTDRPKKERLLIVLSSLSRDYFEYQRTLRDNIGTGVFGEPVPVYTNISGGLGIFAGFANADIVFEIHK